MTGVFYDFFLQYHGRHDAPGVGMDNAQQANAILSRANELIDAGMPGVSITYSANEGQTDALEKAYAAGIYTANISGANQAQVMRHMETALGTPTWSQLQMKLRIAPITTIPYTSDPLEIVQKDIASIGTSLANGWAVLGWMNQDSKGTDHPYAIGGGVNKNIPDNVMSAIQDGLKGFAEQYPEPDGDCSS